MATGRIDVSRTRDALCASILDPNVRREDERTAHLKRNVGCEDVVPRLRKLKRGCFTPRDDDRVPQASFKNGIGVSFVECEDGEIVGADEDPPEKKRKFSPCTLAKDDSFERSPEYNKSHAVRSFKDPCSFESCSSGSDLSSSLDQENHLDAQAYMPPNLYSSRWASDEDYGTDEETQISCTINADISKEDVSDNELEDKECIEDDDRVDGENNENSKSDPRNIDMCEGCRSVTNYERLNEINEGTYGKVYRAREKNTGEIVALKKVKMSSSDKLVEHYGFPLTALREINILMSMYHPNIVNVKEVVMGDLDSVYMVMECMDYDLKGLMSVMKQPFSICEVKCLMLQLLEGVKYLHDNWVLHRDLKTSNLLLNTKGELKLCDFGMARRYGSPIRPYTSLVVTLWYRSPELLLGAKEYSTALDMWSVGCIMAELLSKKPLFPGKSELDQLSKIFSILGTPSDTIWPGFSLLPGANSRFSNQPFNLLRKRFPATSFKGTPALSEKGFDLLNSLLTYDPEKRITADAALQHPWFSEIPLPTAKEFISTFPPQCNKARRENLAVYRILLLDLIFHYCGILRPFITRLYSIVLYSKRLYFFI